MRRMRWSLSFLVLSVVVACAQQTGPVPQGAGPCVSPHTNGPYRCPKTSCGTYTTVTSDDCNIDNEDNCQSLVPVSICCGAYTNYAAGGDPCLITEMRDPRNKARILELAEEYEILVPICSGAYVPARIALAEHKKKGKDNGGL
jgi:hypothetical protein